MRLSFGRKVCLCVKEVPRGKSQSRKSSKIWNEEYAEDHQRRTEKVENEVKEERRAEKYIDVDKGARSRYSVRDTKHVLQACWRYDHLINFAIQRADGWPQIVFYFRIVIRHYLINGTAVPDTISTRRRRTISLDNDLNTRRCSQLIASATLMAILTSSRKPRPPFWRRASGLSHRQSLSSFS